MAENRILFEAQVEIDLDKGILWVHDHKTGQTVIEVSELPFDGVDPHKKPLTVAIAAGVVASRSPGSGEGGETPTWMEQSARALSHALSAPPEEIPTVRRRKKKA